MTDPAIVQPALGLMFILGLRHGLDPDHVAVIDNIVFRTVDTRPRLAPWTGTLFAVGHSLSVAVVAIGVSLFAGLFAVPTWIGPVVEWMVVLLLFLVGALNLSALLKPQAYAPVGWRTALIPEPLRAGTHPLSVIGIGMIFGLVFDTATQAAAWGAAASTMGGLGAATGVAGAFAAGMILSDTIDSQIVSRLLLRRDPMGIVQRYRRAVGWMIVLLSFGMAAYALAGMIGYEVEVEDDTFTLIGFACAASIAALLALKRNRRDLELGAVPVAGSNCEGAAE